MSTGMEENWDKSSESSVALKHADQQGSEAAGTQSFSDREPTVQIAQSHGGNKIQTSTKKASSCSQAELQDCDSSMDHLEQSDNIGSDPDALAKVRSAQTYDEREDQVFDWEAHQVAYNAAKDKFEYFWNSDKIYSQWHDSGFKVDDRYFSCAEQYMMYGKAVLFKDFKIARWILQSRDPRKIKALGRKVRNFDPDLWMRYCLYVVKEGNMAKFSQNEKLRSAIFATFPKVLVEASPKDNIWGIGLDEEHPLAWDENTWQGKNYLGYVLTEVRNELLAKEGKISSGDNKKYIGKLLKDANMSDENIDPYTWKPSSEEAKQLEFRDHDDVQEHEGNWHRNHHEGSNHSYRAEKHTVPSDNGGPNGAKTRRTYDSYHGNSGRRLQREQWDGHNSGGHGNRNNNRSDNRNWRDGGDAEKSGERGHGNRHEQNREQIKEGFSEDEHYVFFWGQRNFYSQWYPTEFEIKKKYFRCAEQYMMYMKAVLFKDDAVAQAILRARDPNQMKKLGREVKGFDEDTWQKHSLQFVKEGNLAKFPADEKLYRVLKRTYPKILVEASPYDRIWGIGLEAHDERAKNKSTWRGTNFLGYILTEVRDELMAKEGLISESDRKIFLPELQKQYASAVKKSQGSKDMTGGWGRYDQMDWRLRSNKESQLNENGAQSPADGRGSQDRQQTLSSGPDFDYFEANNEKPLNDATVTQVVHPTIPGLVYAEETGKKKKKKGKKVKEETISKTPDHLFENSDAEDFQVPEVISPLKQATLRDNLKDKGKSSSADGEWEQVKGKKKGSPVKQKASRTNEKEAEKGKKGKRQGSPENAKVKDSGNSKEDYHKVADFSIEDKEEGDQKSQTSKIEKVKEEDDESMKGLSARQKKNQRRKNKNK